jgi:hypothetical protein
MRLYFGLITAALSFAVVSGAAMAWDGSYILFKILDLQSPFLPHNRLVNIPLHWIVLLTSRLTNDLSILQMVFGAAHAVIPLAALAISWWIVRGYAEPLFIWAALGIGFGTLPAQLCFACEAVSALLLFWPVILAILTRIRKRQFLVILGLIVVIFFTHPISVIIFALGSSLAFTIGLRSRQDRKRMLMWAYGLSAMTVLKSLTFLSLQSSYEMSQLSINLLKFYFDVSVSGFPLISMICTWLAAVMIFTSAALSEVIGHRFSGIMHLIAMASLITAGGLLAVWARDPSLWMYAIAFRLWALFFTVPLILMATFDARVHDGHFLCNRRNEWNFRFRIVQIIGVAFLLVLSIQGTAWFNLTKILRETITQSAYACMSLSSIGWLTRTPLNNWTTPSYAILLQGRAPEKLVLEGDGCTEASFFQAVRIAPWDLRSRTGGWFDLHLSGIVSPQSP